MITWQVCALMGLDTPNHGQEECPCSFHYKLEK